MEMLDGNRQLIRGMEEDGCSSSSGGEEAGLHLQNPRIQPIRRRWTRRMTLFLAAALLLVVAALGLLVAVVLGGRGHQSPDIQNTFQPPRHITDPSVGQQQLQDNQNPSAIVRVPRGNYSDETILDWESKEGNAFCRGGFKCRRQDLVVPRGGIYRVFLQVTFESKEKLKCSSDKTLTLEIGIKVFRDDYPQYILLLSSVDTVSCSMKQWRKSLYTAGLVSLEANSKLQAISSNVNLIVRHEDQVFFGAELLPE